MMTARVSAVESPVVAFQKDGNSELTDLYIAQGRIGATQLSSACYSWTDILQMAAKELWRCGEANAARVTLKAGRQTVRQFLLARFGIVTGSREYWHRPEWTPERADLQDFLKALQLTRQNQERSA